MATFKAFLNTELVNLFTNRFETLHTFLTEVVGSKLVGFIMSIELTNMVSGLSTMNDALISSMNTNDENHGSNAERIKYANRVMNDVNNDLSNEIITFVRGAVQSFIDRFSAIEGTEVFTGRKLRFGNELRLYRENVTRENITADQAIKAYAVMCSFVSWLEGEAQDERDREEAAKMPQSIAARVHATLAPAPSKRTRPRPYVGKGEKRQADSGKGEKKAKKQGGKSRHVAVA